MKKSPPGSRRSEMRGLHLKMMDWILFQYSLVWPTLYCWKLHLMELIDWLLNCSGALALVLPTSGQEVLTNREITSTLHITWRFTSFTWFACCKYVCHSPWLWRWVVRRSTKMILDLDFQVCREQASSLLLSSSVQPSWPRSIAEILPW